MLLLRYCRLISYCPQRIVTAKLTELAIVSCIGSLWIFPPKLNKMAQHFSLLLLLLMHLSHGQEDTASQHDIRHLHSSGLHRQYYCGLQNAPIMKVAKNETSGTLYKIDENTTTATDQVYAVKQCACYSWLINETSMCCSAFSSKLIFSFL